MIRIVMFTVFPLSPCAVSPMPRFDVWLVKSDSDSIIKMLYTDKQSAVPVRVGGARQCLKSNSCGWCKEKLNKVGVACDASRSRVTVSALRSRP